MSKDTRHDGRRRGTGQHRVGPRTSLGMDGRERSGSNSSGSSHGGGKSKNSPLSALKVRGNLQSVLGRDMELNLVKTPSGTRLLEACQNLSNHLWVSLPAVGVLAESPIT